jgi:hypothetical protein
MTIAFVFQKDITRFISVSQIKANYRIMGSKYTGFHVNLRASFVDEINGRTTGFGGAEFDFRVNLTYL